MAYKTTSEIDYSKIKSSTLQFVEQGDTWSNKNNQTFFKYILHLKNGEKPLSYYKGKELAHVSAYMAYTSRGNKFNVDIPNNNEALNAYENGKRLYFTKKGQLNFSCADCHVYQTGTKLRADIPSPAIGHPTHFPVYRSGMGRLVTLHERFAGCLNRIRAKSYPGGSDEYNNLEYFMSFMSNGLEVNGPGSRK